MVQNIMTVDLEDYFCDLKFKEWENFSSRIEQTTQSLLDLFNKYDVKATFFILGYIAENFPDLIRKIQEEGHEIASHGYHHLDIRQLTKEQFEKDLLLSINTLEKITGNKVLGFRAPFFSIDKNTFWAIDILKKYLKYDSSIFPIRTPLYGVPNAPRFVYRPNAENPINNDPHENFIEIPPATHHISLIGNIPIAGGFHFRFLPYFYIKYGLKKLNKKNIPAVFYIHPKDLDRDMPKIPSYGWFYYFGLKKAKQKFEKLLEDFHFSSIKEVLGITL